MEVIDNDLNTFILEDDDYPTPVIITARYYPAYPGKPASFGSEGMTDWGEPAEPSCVDIEEVFIRTNEGDIPCNNNIVCGSIDENRVCETIEEWGEL